MTVFNGHKKSATAKVALSSSIKTILTFQIGLFA